MTREGTLKMNDTVKQDQGEMKPSFRDFWVVERRSSSQFSA